MKRTLNITLLIVTILVLAYGMFHGVRETNGALTPSLSSGEFKPEERSRWFLADTPSPKAVALLIHGLNQKPSMWKDMVTFLNKLGVHVYRLTLKGHGGGPFRDMTSVTAKDWLKNVAEANAEMETRFHDVPKILVGYSTGALVALDYQLTKGKPYFTKQILFAPAISLQDYTYLLKPLTYFATYLPSRSPEDYRANKKGTAMSAYRAMFDLLNDVEDSENLKIINTDTMVFINPEDELIDIAGIEKLTKNHQLDKWKLFPILNQQSDLKPETLHLIIDTVSLGRAGWGFVTSKMSEFLR